MRAFQSALLLAAVSSTACAQSGPQVFESQLHRFRVVTVARGLEHPWGLAFLPDGRILVTERRGRLRIAGPDGRLSEPFAGVPDVWAHGQGGLLDVALAPDFERTQTIYLSYAEPGTLGSAGTTVARAQLGDGRLENLEVVFRQGPSGAPASTSARGSSSRATACSTSRPATGAVATTRRT